MEKRRLGNSDLEVSLVGLGCNNFGMKLDLAGTRAVVDAAIANGIDFFDTADMYGGTKSESFLGEVLEGGGRRNAIVLATKFGGMAYATKGSKWGTRAAIVESCEASLARLRTDRIDLYQMHYPDPQTPIDETLTALGELVQAGKVRAIGCSNFTRALLEQAGEAAEREGRPRFASLQNEWSLLAREIESEVVPACEKQGAGILPYFPLASGVLTGKYKRGQGFAEGTRLASMEYFHHFGSDENLARVERLEAFARERGHTLLALAMGWLATQPCVASVIAGATTPAQVKANAEALGWRLDAGELARVDEITRSAA